MTQVIRRKGNPFSCEINDRKRSIAIAPIGNIPPDASIHIILAQ